MSAHARIVRSVLRDYFEEYGTAKQEAQTMACLDELVAENQRLRDALERITLVYDYRGADYPSVTIREMNGIARRALDRAPHAQGDGYAG